MAPDIPFGDSPGGMGGFLPNMLEDVMKMMRAQDPSQFEIISQLAVSVAGDAEEGNVEPRDRIMTDDLTRIAELHVADVTGMTITPTGKPLQIHTLNRTDWVRRSLERWRPLIEQIVRAQSTEPTISEDSNTTASAESNDVDDVDEMAGFVQRWLSMFTPTLRAMQIGSMVGHLSERALGQYDLPLPGDFTDGPGLIAKNRRALAADWSLPENDLALWLITRDITLHAVLSRPHVQELLSNLLINQMTSLRIDASALQDRLGELSPGMFGDMEQLAQIMGTGDAFSATIDSPLVRQNLAELTTLVTVIIGYAEWVTDTVAARAIGARGAITEALRRQRVERSDEERSADAFIGVELNQDLFDRGRNFVQGIIDRQGESDLARLWVVTTNIPTPNELDAPGLWLERINLPPEPNEN